MVTLPCARLRRPPRSLPRSKVVRKGIARVLTVVNQKTRDALKEAYKGKVRLLQRTGGGRCCCRCAGAGGLGKEGGWVPGWQAAPRLRPRAAAYTVCMLA